MHPARKLKILHLTSHLDIGGVTRHVQLLGRTMVREGHRIDVASGGGSLEAEFRGDGIGTHTFPIRKKSILSPSLCAALPALKKLLRDGGYDVIHSHTRVTHALARRLRGAGVPAVNTYHGYFRRNLGRRLFPYWGDRIIAVSGPVAEDLRATHRAPVDRVRTVNNAIDLERSARSLAAQNAAAVRQKHGVPADAFVLGYVARLVEDKGHEVLLRAFAKLLPDFPELFLFLAGEGRELPRLEKAARELGVRDRVVMGSSVSDISEALRVTDVFVHPAFYREGFGLGIAEAMAAGVPVVLTNIPAIHKIFRPGECCVMAEPSDIGSLAGAIRYLLEAPGERRRIAAAGQAFARELCDPARQARETEAIYAEVLP